ncbi:MAG: hypothetical protein IJJ48_02820 [Firmicutes bacterium]|nr:hypothetical protein [Bacillota bacterium]
MKTVKSTSFLTAYYDLKTWSDVNYTISTLELYFEKYPDMSTEEFDKMIQKAWRLKMTGNFYRKK